MARAASSLSLPAQNLRKMEFTIHGLEPAQAMGCGDR